MEVATIIDITNKVAKIDHNIEKGNFLSYHVPAILKFCEIAQNWSAKQGEYLNKAKIERHLNNIVYNLKERDYDLEEA